MKYLVSIFLGLTLTSCATLSSKAPTQKPVIFDTQAEAGKVRISPLPVIPWEDVSKKLQPNFTLKNADQVLPLVLPNTTASEYVYRSSQASNIGLNLLGPTSTKSSAYSSTVDLVTDDVTSATEEVTSTRNISPAEIPSASTSPVLGSSSYAQIADFKPGFDPSLSYRAAAALYQEIQLLNSYLDTSFLTEDDKMAYLFRIQVTVDGSTRGQPLNLKSRLWLADSVCRPRNEEVLKFTSNETDVTQSYQEEESKCDLEGNTQIIPILVAENGERSSNNRLVEAASQFENSLSALVGNQGIGAEYQSLKSELNTLRGTDYNSLLNLSLTAENELLLSIGASYSPTYGLEMRNRTYDISFLVLVPRERPTVTLFGQQTQLYGVNTNYKSVDILESTQFINAETGNALPLINEAYLEDLTKELEQELSVFRIPENIKEKVRNDITNSNIQNSTLESCLDTPCNTRLANYRSIYDKLITFRDIINPNKIQIPIPKLKRTLPAPQSVFANDKTSAGITATLVAPKAFQLSDDFAAILIAKKSSAASADHEIVFPARSVSLDGQGKLVLKFPSLSDIGISTKVSDAILMLGYSDLASDNLEKAKLARKARKLPTKLHHQAEFELAPGSTRQYKVVFDKKNTAKPEVKVVFKTSTLPKSPTVDEKNDTKFRLITTVNTSKAAVPIEVKVKNGIIESVTLAGTSLKAADAAKLPTGWNSPTVNKATNSFKASHNNAYEIVLQGVTKGMEIEVEVQQLKKDGTPDKDQKASIKFKTAK